MKAKDFVLSKYPNAFAAPIIDNRRRQTSYIIIKNFLQGSESFGNTGCNTASKAWTQAKKRIIMEESNIINQISQLHNYYKR